MKAELALLEVVPLLIEPAWNRNGSWRKLIVGLSCAFNRTSMESKRDRRFSLSLDLAEIFKPLIIDRIIFRLFNRQQLDESKHFETNVDGCYLNENGRKLFIAEFDEQLKQTISHRRLKRHVSYQRLIRLECYKLIKHLVEMEPYQALRPWW